MTRHSPRLFFPLILVLWGCTTTWEKHQQLANERRASGDIAGAVAAQKWLVEQGFMNAPPAARGPAHDVARLLALAELLGKAGQVGPAVEAYREALRIDPGCLEAVLTGVGLLRVTAAQREALMDELIQNAMGIDPRSVPARQGAAVCWSYTVREVRVRRIWTRGGPDGLEREAVYDARPWVYDVASRTWRLDGNWVVDAGREVQVVNGPENPNYRALTDADGGFYADGIVPPCHAGRWRGPYDLRRQQVFAATELPRP